MKVIDRHAIKIEEQLKLRTTLAKMLPMLVEGIESDPFKLATLTTQGIYAAGRELVLGGDIATARDDLALAGAAGVALFEAVLHPGEPLVAHLGGRAVPFRGFPSNNLAGARAWLEAFQLALINRDLAGQDALLAIPDSLLHPSGIQSEDFVYRWIETLRSFLGGAPEFAAHLIRALEGTDPRGLRHSPAEWVLNLDVPQMDLLSKLASDDQPGFDAALAKAIELHKKYWGKPARSHEPSGFLALGPLAFACMAYDQGWPLNVESPYIPRALVERA